MEIIYKQIVPKIKFLRVNCGKFEPETFQSVGANATRCAPPSSSLSITWKHWQRSITQGFTKDLQKAFLNTSWLNFVFSKWQSTLHFYIIQKGAPHDSQNSAKERNLLIYFQSIFWNIFAPLKVTGWTLRPKTNRFH